MQKLILLIGLCLLAFIPSVVEGKDPCHYSTEGTDFWFGFMQNRRIHPDHYLEITVSSRNGAEFTLTYGPEEKLIGKYTVEANSSIPVPIEYDLLEASGSETIEDKGIHLYTTNSSDSVNVYALNYRTQSADVAVIYPTESLGKEYFAMCYTPHPTGSIESNTEFLIVATEDNTHVEITPIVDTDRGKKANQMFTVILNKGQSYQVQSNNSNVQGQGDLTGSYILSDQPIAFYSGAKSTAVPYTGQSRDHLYEQIPSTNTWGREFYLVPLKQRYKDTYRIIAAEDSTVVTIEALNETHMLKKGIFYEFDLWNDQACRLRSSEKILLAQFCRSQEVDGNDGVGDPFMIILSPVSQKINDVTFDAYESALIRDKFYVNIITLASETDQILLDDIPIKSSFINFPKGDYAYAQIPIGPGQHHLFNPDKKNGGFLAYVYGFGDRTESYGYGVGFNLDIQLEIGGSFEPTEDTLQICNGNSVQLVAGEYFEKYLWKPTNDTTATIRVSRQDWYSVTATNIEGCQKTDDLFVEVLKPEIYLGQDTSVCLPGEMIIEAEKGFKSYRWQDESTNPNFTVDSTGFYSVIVTDYGLNCQATDTIHVEVIMPTLKFKPDFPVVTIEHPEITFTNLTKDALTYSWDFGDGQHSTEMNPTIRYSEIKKYPVVLTATSEFNCTDNVQMEVEVIPVQFFIPNAFRPDSDIPENRIFQPMLNIASVDPKNYQFRIFNRVGSSIFESRNPETGWTGKNSVQGVYVWIVKYLDIQGYEHSQKGTVMLVR